MGLVPSYGAILTIVFSITDTISFLKVSDLEKLRECLQLKEKPHKKYKKIKNILIIKNCSYLSVEDAKKVQFIKELIDKKYIINTLLIIFEPLDFPSDLEVNKDAVYTIALDNNVLNDICGFSVEDNYLKMINVLGIEYAEYIRNLDDSTVINNDSLVHKFINDMLKKGGYDESEELLDFLKLCSLLFDVFSYEDIENVSSIKEICSEVELKKSMNLNLIESSMPNEYRFFMSFLRNYYQENAQFYGSEVKRQILNYLKEKYPTKYTDLALASILTSNNDAEKISLCLKSLYYEKNKSAIYKTEQIINFLSKSSYITLANISKLNRIYDSLDYSHTDTKQLCMQSILGFSDLDFLSTVDKLMCLSSIAKVAYELMSQEFLKTIDKLYRKFLRSIQISKTYKLYTPFILDYIVFSTCIEDSYETAQVVQRLVAYLKKHRFPWRMKLNIYVWEMFFLQ